MSKKSITVGEIFGLIGALFVLFWVMGFLIDFSEDPLDAEHVNIVADKTVEIVTPSETNIILRLAPYGIVGVVGIILFIALKDKVMNTRIPLNI